MKGGSSSDCEMGMVVSLQGHFREANVRRYLGTDASRCSRRCDVLPAIMQFQQ